MAKLKENNVAMKYVTELKRCLQDVTAGSIDAIRQAVNRSVPEWEHIKKKWITEATLEKIQQKRQLKLMKENSANRTREVYKLVRVLKRKWQPQTSAIKDKMGKTLTDKLDIMERWTDIAASCIKTKTTVIQWKN